MKLSLIVPFYNAEETLAACLESLLAQRGADCEVIAVDNASTDRSTEIAKRLEAAAGGRRLRVVTQPVRGREHARNLGSREAVGDLLLFTDADCVADPAWAAEMEKAFAARPEIAGAGGRVRGHPPENLVQKFLGIYTLRSAATAERIFEKFDLFEGGFPGANLAVRREMFEKIGGFDPQFPFFGGDYDLCARLYAAGGKMACVPAAVVGHQHRKKIAPMMRQSYGFGGTQAVLLAKYFPREGIVELPGKTWRRTGFVRPFWINLTYLDKKTLAALVLASLWPPLIAILLVYQIYWMAATRKIAAEEKIPLSWVEAALLFGLMFLKSAAMSAGRVLGGVQMKAICW